MPTTSHSRRRMILHVGPSKTGTTTLQEQVFPHLVSVCFMGKPWWNPNVSYDKCIALHRAIDSVTKADSTSYDPFAAKAAVDDWLAHAPGATSIVDGSPLPRFLSEERLTVSDVVSMDEIARRLAGLFPCAEIVYVKRDPVSGLRSGHRWLYARAWTDASFSDWLAEGMMPAARGSAAVALRSYDWRLLEQSFGAHFSSVRSVEFEEMLDDTGAFLRQILGIDTEEFDSFNWLKDRPLNISRNRAVSELHRATKKAIRLWNRLPFGKIDEKPEYLGDTVLWNMLEVPLRGISLGERKLAVTHADRKRILEYYARNNALPLAGD